MQAKPPTYMVILKNTTKITKKMIATFCHSRNAPVWSQSIAYKDMKINFDCILGLIRLINFNPINQNLTY